MNKIWPLISLFTLSLVLYITPIGIVTSTAQPARARVAETLISTPLSPLIQSTDTLTPVTYSGLPLPLEKGELFAASGMCAICHTSMVDASGADVSNDSMWRSTMMANAARDPYWQAAVRKEILNFPELQAVIEDKCATCHMPMARTTVAANGEKGQIFGDGFANPENSLHTLAMDGVSCTVCHQIEDANFGEESSFGGGFVINTDLPTGERLNYGPYPVEETTRGVMQYLSGFMPIQSQHIKQSELCATCHTLSTPTVDTTTGEIAGEFPEQMAYFEWLNSDYKDSTSCQDCHMPEAQGEVALSTTWDKPHSGVRNHIFVGGNVYVLSILRQFGPELGVTASSKHFSATITSTKAQLQNDTAAIALEGVALSGPQLTANVVVNNQAGHKFPTGFPSRRAWLHVTVQDAAGQIVFESGGFNADGSIVGNDNDGDPSLYEPHYPTISKPEQVQIYEDIIHNTNGEVTTILLRGAGYIKDNRLLPPGFEKSKAQDNIAISGLAVDDGDFVGGGDTVQYAIDVQDAEGPFTVTAELLYQSIGYRWAENLRPYQAEEITRFLSYNQAVPNLPVVVAGATVEVE